MSADLEFTGERFLPGTAGEIAHEHWHRYAFARRFVAGRRVLDVACGEGYGSALLAEAAAHVTGVDIDSQTLAHARSAYADRANVDFALGSAASLPIADASADAVVSFETIEHLDAADQPKMLAEFARVLAPDGVLVLSSPNRPEYSERRGYVNPFHRHELDRDELTQLLAPHFPSQRWYRQRRYFGSALWAEAASPTYEAMSGTAASAAAAAAPEAMYFVVVAARSDAPFSAPHPGLSLFTDRDDSELDRIEREAREVLRLDGLLRTRDDELRAQARYSYELEAKVMQRESMIAERDERVAYRDGLLEARERAHAAEIEVRTRTEAELAAAHAERERLAREIEAQERIISYRASVRWWLKLPWIRARRVWNRIRAAAP
jgi:SAM-dependent methyltransferase